MRISAADGTVLRRISLSSLLAIQRFLTNSVYRLENLVYCNIFYRKNKIGEQCKKRVITRDDNSTVVQNHGNKVVVSLLGPTKAGMFNSRVVMVVVEAAAEGG